MKQAKTNKQYTETEDLLTIFAISYQMVST